jgi:hypothetical protein
MIVKHIGDRKSFEDALLECESPESCGKWTKHEYAGLKLVKYTKPVGDDDGYDYYKIFYQCTQCGLSRVWGTFDKKYGDYILSKKKFNMVEEN